MTDIVYTRDVSSGRIHKRYLTDSGDLATLEADNLEASVAGAYEVVDASVVESADEAALCRRCFAQRFAEPLG